MKKTLISVSVLLMALLMLTGFSVWAEGTGTDNGILTPNDAITKTAALIYPYIPNSSYTIYCRADRLVEIQLQVGEKFMSIDGADTVRWVIGQELSGSGITEQWHFYVKPAKDDPALSTSFCINTNLHSYYIEAYISAPKFTKIVCWTYPQEEKTAILRVEQQKAEDEANNIPLNASLEEMSFSYSISGNYGWSPKMVFSDGKKTYIKMPDTMAAGDAPVLFVKENGKLVLVNYRVKNSYYIVDRLFDQAEMRNGKEVVKIERLKK